MTSLSSSQTLDWNQQLEGLSLEARLSAILAAYPQGLVFACSFGPEDCLLLHALLPWQQKIKVVFLDTGRLPEETYEVQEQWRLRFGWQFQVEYPDHAALSAFVSQHGPQAFYESQVLRQQCCALRKIQGLQRALADAPAWITGLRRSQSLARSSLDFYEKDAAGRAKFAVLADFSFNQVWQKIRTHTIPYNRLHDKGYRSIGCSPCTRPILEHEEERAGRWWWEQSHKECGLHPIKESNDASQNAR